MITFEALAVPRLNLSEMLLAREEGKVYPKDVVLIITLVIALQTGLFRKENERVFIHKRAVGQFTTGLIMTDNYMRQRPTLRRTNASPYRTALPTAVPNGR